MKKKHDIKSHSYNDTVDNVLSEDGKPVFSLDPQFPFSLVRFECMNALAQAEYPHRHDYYEILFITEGEGLHVIDFDAYQVKAPMFYFLRKDQAHFWQLEKPLKGYALLFPDEFIDFPTSNIIRAHDLSFFNHVGKAPFLLVQQENHAMINRLLEDIEQEYLHENMKSLTVLRAYLHILLTKLHRLYLADHPAEYSASTSSLVFQFNNLVSEHFHTDHSVQDYAKRIGVSASHLRDTVKEVTGYAPGNIIRKKIVLEAKRLLAHSNVTVAEIGYRLNFDDSSYFCRFFKREADMSPIVFREKIREQYKILPE